MEINELIMKDTRVQREEAQDWRTQPQIWKIPKKNIEQLRHIRDIRTILATNHSLACGMYKVGPLRRYRVTFCVAASRLYTTRTSLASSEIAGCVWMSSWMSGFTKNTQGL